MMATRFSNSTGDVAKNATTTMGDSAKKTSKLTATLVALALVAVVSLCIVFSQDEEKPARRELSVTGIAMNGKSRSLQPEFECGADVSAIASGIEWILAQAASSISESFNNSDELQTWFLMSIIMGHPASIALSGLNQFVSSALVDSSGFLTFDLRALNGCVRSLIMAPLLLLQKVVEDGLGSSFLDSDWVGFTPIMMVVTNIFAAIAESISSMGIQSIKIGGLDTFTKLDLLKLSKQGEETEMATQISLDHLTIQIDVGSGGSESISSVKTLTETWTGVDIVIPLVHEIIIPLAKLLQGPKTLETIISAACIFSAVSDPQGASISVAETSGDAIPELLGGDITVLPGLIQNAFDYLQDNLRPTIEQCVPELADAELL